MVKCVQKTYTIARKLSVEITLISIYCGNFIALVIGIAIPIFSQHRNNPGMYSLFKDSFLKILI